MGFGGGGVEGGWGRRGGGGFVNRGIEGEFFFGGGGGRSECAAAFRAAEAYRDGQSDIGAPHAGRGAPLIYVM